MRDYYIVYKKKILDGPMSKEAAILKLFDLSSTFKGLRVRSYFGKNKPMHAHDDMTNNDMQQSHLRLRVDT
jgi:hypothetical protein